MGGGAAKYNKHKGVFTNSCKSTQEGPADGGNEPGQQPLPASSSHARPKPGAAQMGLGPHLWGITLEQLLGLRHDVAEHYDSKQEDASCKSMRDVVDDVIKPRTRGRGIGYALLLNSERPIQAKYMVSHSWDEGFLDFVDALRVGDAEIAGEGLWICAVALFQKEDDDCGPGPTVHEQLGDDVLEGPFVVVVRQASRLLVVQTDRSQVYTRLWCVLELYQAMELDVGVTLLGAWTVESTRTLDPERAVCHCPEDARRIRRAIEETCGWERLAQVILSRMKRILATRSEWPVFRPWEWKVLEAIRLDDPALVREAAEDPDVDWSVTISDRYGDRFDQEHTYHLVMSFGLHQKEGLTLMQTALLNGRMKSARAIEAACTGPRGQAMLLPEEDESTCVDGCEPPPR